MFRNDMIQALAETFLVGILEEFRFRLQNVDRCLVHLTLHRADIHSVRGQSAFLNWL